MEGSGKGGSVHAPAPFLSISSEKMGKEAQHEPGLPAVASSKVCCYCADLLPYFLGKEISEENSG